MTIISEADRKEFQGAIREISGSMTRMEAERDLIREIIKEKSDKFQIPKKTISKIAKTYHKQNFQQAREENEEFETLYEEVTAPTN